jgi:DNA repair exonuclease SbcCD ATPase subunit
MAEEAGITTQDPGKDGTDEATKTQKVPYERFQEVNERAKQYEAKLEELQSKLVEFEDRDKSETERERAARERAEARANELLEQVTGLQKGSWVRSAA